MKIFEVTYVKESVVLSKPFGCPGTYYDVDGKQCFSADVFHDTIKDTIKAPTEEAIRNHYYDIISMVSIKHIDEVYSVFDTIVPNDYTALISSVKLSSILYGQRDCPCDEEVQKRYQINNLKK